MKTILYFAAAVMLGCTMNGATLLFRRDGTPYSLRDWSSPELLALNSSRGPVQALKRTNLVDRMDSQYTERLSIDLVYSPTSQAVLVGHPYEHYFAIGEEIYGAATQGTDLLIKRSDSPGSGDFETIKDRAITEFVKDPGTAFSVLGATYAFDLTRIFGRGSIVPENDARGWVKPVTITHVGIGPTRVTFGFSTVSGSDLSLAFTTDFRLISASKNGKEFLVLQDGRFPFAHDWPGPSEISVISPEGQVIGLDSSKVYYTDGKLYYTEEAQGRRAYPMRAVVLPSTGDIWIGPEDSRLVVFNRGIVGILLHQEKELLLFASRGSRIPISQAARAAFQEEISKFEKVLLAGRFTEDSRISIRSLFPNDPIVSEASPFAVKEISFAGAYMVIKLRTYGPGPEVEVKIGPELRVTSAKKTR